MANIDVMYSSKTNEWSTPQEFFKALDAEFDFTLDPCADKSNHKCGKYFTKQQNGLCKNWGGNGCSAILRTAKRLVDGFRNATKKATKKTLWWFCSYQHGRIPSISTITYCTGQK